VRRERDATRLLKRSYGRAIGPACKGDNQKQRISFSVARR